MHSKRKWLPSWQRVELVELCLEQGATRRQAAAWRRVSVSTVQHWVDRFRAASEHEQATGSWALDRPSTPHHQPTRVSDDVHDQVCEARERTGWGPRLIASDLGMAHATVSRCLTRRGMSRWPACERDEVRRFEWPCPGDLLQMDTKRLARFSRPGHAVTGDRHVTGAEKRERVGWEFCHSIIDDHTRIAYTEIHRDEKAATVTAFVARALVFYARLGITPRRLQTDNAWTYIHNTSLRELLAQHSIQHRRIPPRTPKRNGKVERYQQTLAREWAYGQRYRNSDARAAALPIWLKHYNTTATTARSQTGHPSAAFGTTRGTTASAGSAATARGSPPRYSAFAGRPLARWTNVRALGTRVPSTELNHGHSVRRLWEHVFVLMEATRAQVVQHRLIEMETRDGSRMVERLALVAELDGLGEAQRLGYRSTAHWLSVECRLEGRTARDYVRIGHRLEVWPLVREALRDGQLTYSQCRALARASVEEDEAALLAVALKSTVVALERHVQALRSAPSADPDVAEAAEDRRSLRFVWDEDGSMAFWGRVGPVGAAALVEAVETVMHRLPSGESLSRRRADALVEIMLSGCPKTTLMLHADLRSLAGDPDGERLHLRDGPSLPPELARRLTCDAMVSIAGLNFGRVRRLVTTRQRRALEDRDGRVCWMPGCDCTHGLDAHHIVHWVNGGRTDLDNLVLLCPYHHRLFHEGGWHLAFSGKRVVVVNQDGVIVDERLRPPPCAGRRRQKTASRSHARPR